MNINLLQINLDTHKLALSASGNSKASNFQDGVKVFVALSSSELTKHLPVQFKALLLVLILCLFSVLFPPRIFCATLERPDTIQDQNLREVVVTAQESRKATSASLIDSVAMQHLQPSSFSDLLELIPGNVTKDPDMSQVNSISLRQAWGASVTDDYATAALGTLFVVDGMPLNTNSQLQTTPDPEQAARIGVGRGVDMRRLSTDDIQQVEIVRGIPSVEYGELTSGLVRIKRKSGVSRFQARFKADNQSRLIYVGKGFGLGGSGFILNTSLSWLDAKIDPRNNRENYKRLGATLRSDFHKESDQIRVHWNSALDYTGTFETDNNDPDLTVNGTIDSFRKRDHSLSWGNNLTLNPIEDMFFKEAEISAGIQMGWESLIQQKHVSSSRIMPLPVSTQEGSNYVGYLPLLYLADYEVDGKPMSAYAKISSLFRHSFTSATMSLKAGAQWDMSKNYGGGEIYDTTRPLVAGNYNRPRPFRDIPSLNQLSAYAETDWKWFPGNFTFSLNPGLRMTSLVGLDHRYVLDKKVYLDPRVNATVVFPNIYASGYPINIELCGGVGQHTKMPVAAYLFPNLLYSDFEQLNYYHNVPQYRTMNVMTYIEDLTNYDLRAARNLKWEVRGDISYRGNRLSVTFFKENMRGGFRHAGTVHRYTYNRYDASGFDPYTLDRAPKIEELPFTPTYYQAVRSKITNGSQTRKTGVEFTLQSRRVPALLTRLTVTGAWLRTTNCNSDPLWYKPSIVIGGNELQFIGLYDDRDGNRYESFNTNFLFDTDIPRLKLNFSISIQNMWYTLRQGLWKDGIPTHYVDPDGAMHQFTQADMDDPYLSQLVRKYASGAFDKIKTPLETTINFKATKSFWKDRIGLAIYVNRLFAIMPDYERYGVTMRRYTSPYFGMEINLSL